MYYDNVRGGIFLSRKNRFTAVVDLGGREEEIHIKNTGRLGELLVRGNNIYLQKADRTGRKTRFDLIAVEKEGRIINVDSQAPNAAAAEWISAGNLLPDLKKLRKEVSYGSSRFDLYAEYGEERAFLEVKGVTLEQDGIARFPDAPTERGVKHLQELIRCIKDGYRAYLLFVIQMQGVSMLEPNRETHPLFAQVLEEAADRGVRILAFDSLVEPDRIEIMDPVPVRFHGS